ncbi:hypothetical protein TH9_20545 [Thalassospira xiamenensis]|uniref:hypothetical protein n=1 Tax=Thalassospira xiamenensis TaxID=220697 RepID=UPI000DFE87D7|nr:hypothetical protein [Thalassospira xiamenensis]RCK29669.1 hypothetical protein TH9_20545 [Thalassospira xiamenensis]
MRPDYLVQGEVARLFPVLATTSKEGRTTSIVLSCIANVDEFGKELLKSVGVKTGKKAVIEAYTEVVFSAGKEKDKDRPDGLLVVKTGKKEWRALIETKVGANDLNEEQIERYRAIAKDHALDCVITVSNQFSSRPENHPLQSVRKSRSKIPVYHWSWMFILTAADLLINNEQVEDVDQMFLLNELKRFLTHESAGVKGFDRMPPEWSELNKQVSAAGGIPAKSLEAMAVLEAWHQETRDLSLILSRQTETVVSEKLPRKHLQDPGLRLKEEFASLRETGRLQAVLAIPDAASPVEIYANILSRTVSVEMFLRAPEDRKSTKARVTWLLRQLKNVVTPDIHVRLMWPGSSEATHYSLEALREDPAIAETDKNSLQVLGFHVFLSRRLGARFTQNVNFISDLEAIVPEFYRTVGQNLVAWRKAAPRIKSERDEAADVSIDAMEGEAEEFAMDN